MTYKTLKKKKFYIFWDILQHEHVVTWPEIGLSASRRVPSQGPYQCTRYTARELIWDAPVVYFGIAGRREYYDYDFTYTRKTDAEGERRFQILEVELLRPE